MDKETSEIAKLTGRISKDPKSKLFVPLAEEYKKAGDIEMAIHVLLEGLKNNPDYIIARSSLGKLLLAKGDLAGAQKEFEDVVRSVPDNVMAQKKLGDIFILQSKPLDALSHYQIALSLNPGDEELTSLISNVEAGRDVTTKIQSSAAKTTAGQAINPEPAAPGPVRPQKANDELNTPDENASVSQAISPTPFRETAQATVFSMTETEEPEEVLIVEPLEAEDSVQEPLSAGLVLPESPEPKIVPSVVDEESFDFDLSAGDQLPDEQAVSLDIRAEAEQFTVGDRGTITTGVSAEIGADELIETVFEDEVSEKIPETSFEGVSGTSDDFTTDTLAELYISQGFFEKAIEIYERMLVDRPDSRGLQEKLSWVRAQFAGTVAPASEQKIDANVLAEQEALEYFSAADAGESVDKPREEQWPQQTEGRAGLTDEAAAAGEYIPPAEPEEMLLDAEVVAEPGEFGLEIKSSEENNVAESDYSPAAGRKEQTTARENAGFNVLEDTSQAQAGLKRDFEPREYVPPVREQEPLEAPSPDNEYEINVPSSAGRKATIARLETWLTTIKKEK
jgi:tetratricopeptide (TPR) repeat protein